MSGAPRSPSRNTGQRRAPQLSVERMANAPRCSARSKRSGVQCRKLALCKPESGYTRHCRFHGGVQERAAPGDPVRPGRPESSGLYVRHFKRDDDPEVIRLARARIGTLDDELVLLRRNLDALNGRIESATGRERNRLAGFVGEHVDRIARVEERRARVLAILQGLDSPPDPVRLILDSGDAPEEPTDEARQRLREKLLRDGD